MSTKSNRVKNRLRRGLHYGLIANGVSALLGISCAMAIRVLSHRGFTFRCDPRIMFDIVLGGALISYCLVECERLRPILHGVLAGTLLTTMALVAFKSPCSGWFGQFGAVFAVTAAIKPLSRELGKWLGADPPLQRR